MSATPQDLPAKLLEARQQLKKAQMRVLKLEAQLSDNSSFAADSSLNNVPNNLAPASAEPIRSLYRTLGVLSDINQAIVRTRHIPTLLQQACQIAVEKGAFNMAWVGLIDPTTQSVKLVAHTGIAESDWEAHKILLSGDLHGTSATARSLRAGKHVIYGDIAHDTRAIRWRAAALQVGYRAAAVFPLMVAGETRGTLKLYTSEIGFFDDAELRLLDEMAGDLSFAMEFAEQEEQRLQAQTAVQRYALRMEILHEIDTGLIRGGSIQDLVQVTLAQLRRLIPCQRADVSIIDETANETLVFAVALEGDTVLNQGVRVPIPPNVFEGYDARRMRLFEDIRLFQETQPRAKRLVNEGLLSALSILLVHQDRPIGTLGLFSNAPGFFNAEYQQIAAEVGNQLAIAIHQMQLSEALAQHSAELKSRVSERTAELYAAKERVEAILDNSVDGILLITAELRIQQTNASFDRLFASSKDAYFDQPLSVVIQNDDMGSLAGFFQKVTAEGREQILELHAIRMDGTVFDAELSAGAVQGDGLVCTIRDITERKRVEAALNASFAEELEFQNYLKALHEITIELTQIDQLDAFYRRVIEAGRERLGFDRLALFLYDEKNGEALGTFGTDSEGQISDERHVRFAPDPNAMMARAIKRAERFYFEETVTLYQNMEPVASGWNAAAVLWNGDRSVGWLVADNLLSKTVATIPLLDILGLYALAVGTLLSQKQVQVALKESEARYRLLADNINDLVSRTDASGSYSYISPSSLSLIGYQPGELLHKSAYELIHPDDLGDLLAQQAFALNPNATMTPSMHRLRHKNGHYIWVETSGQIIWSEDKSQVLGFVAVSRDLTERKHAEEALRQSEQMLHSVIENIPVRLFWKDRNSVYRGGNTLYAQTIGLASADELGGKSDFDFFPENAVEWMTEDRQVMETGQSLLHVESSTTDADGSIHWQRSSKVALRDSNGNANGVLVTSEDITERKQVAAELDRQRLFLRSVIDVSPNMIFVKDYDARFVLVNEMVAKMTNSTVENLIGKSDVDFNASPSEVENFLEADRRVIISGEPLFIEEPTTSFTGERRWLQTTKVPIMGADGKSKYVLGVSTDITERKRSEAALQESEEKYRSLIETMRGGLAIFDIDNRITFINDRFCELVGYSREETIGTLAVDYVDASNLPLLKSQLERREHLESSSYELLFRHKDGKPVYMMVSGSPLLDKNGKFSGSFVVTTDISAQKQAEEVLRQALNKERELSELKSRFVSMASHEFRTPLATILALTETLSAYRRKLSDDQIDQRFDKIKEQVGNLKDIMEDMLLLARMQSRRMDFTPTLIDLDNLCRSVIDEFQTHVDIRHQIEFRGSPVARQVILDKKLMRQVLSNLISNAIKYSPPDHPVRISLEYTEALIIFSVSDEGIGIPESDLPHLFEPFHRAANVGTISGTGLGLVITKESIELHGGTIDVVSQIDHGTTFTIHIPILLPGEGTHATNSGA